MKEDFLKLEELTTAKLNSLDREKTIFFIKCPIKEDINIANRD